MEKLEIIECEDLSGPACRIYSVKIDDGEDTLFDQFVDKYYDQYEHEVQDIYDRLKVIGRELGMREIFYKPDEGMPGDGICALYDVPDSNVRLYFVKYGNDLILLGDGGPKPKNIRAWQESAILSKVVPQLHIISDLITKATKEKDIRISRNGFEGEMTIFADEY